MKLTAEVILERLENKMKVSSCGNLIGRPPFGRPLLYEKGLRLRKGYFYVAAGGTVQEKDFFGKDICLLLVGRPGETCSAGEIPYISLETEESIFRVLNEIQEIFDKLEDWKDSLGKICSESGSLKELLEASRSVFENPLLVVETDFTLKAAAGQEDMQEEDGTALVGICNTEHMNALKQDKAFRRMQSAEEAVLYTDCVTGRRSYNLNLREKGKWRFRLVVTEFNKTLTRGDVCLMEYLAPYLLNCISGERGAQGQNHTLRMIFERILTDRTADYMEISRQLTSFGWESQAEYMCLIFQITYLDQKSLTTNALCTYLEKNYSGACSFAYKDEIVTFFNLTMMEMDGAGLEGKLKYFIRENFLKAGYSWVMEGHGNLRRQYVQAEIALDVGSRVSPYRWIHHFSEISFSYILEQSAKRLPGYMLCHEKLLELQRLDEQQSTEYMKTLKMYLDEHLNAMQSAKKLFIHRSTFLYRLEKIKLILETDFEDAEELLYLSFSFRLLEKEKEKKNTTYKA